MVYVPAYEDRCKAHLRYKTIEDLKGVSAAICNDRDSNSAIAIYAKDGVNFLV